MARKAFSQKLYKKDSELLADAIIETEEEIMPAGFANKTKKHLKEMLKNKKVFIGGGSLVIATFVANFLNYIFNAYLGRILSFNEFGLIGLIGGLYSFASIFFGAYSTTVNYRSGFLIGKYGEGAGYAFWKYMRRLALYPTIIVTCLWVISIPFLMNFFHTDNIYLFLLFSFVLSVGFVSNVNLGFLFSKMMFGSLAIMGLVDPFVKLTTVFILVFLGLKIWTFTAIPIALMAVFTTGSLLISKQVSEKATKAPLSEVNTFPNKFFTVSLLATFSSVAFFTFDIFLAKHFLSPTHAGEYVLVTLVGKMIFFLGNLTSPFVIPFISRYEGAKKNSLHALYILLGFTALFVFAGFFLFGVMGSLTVPILYGEKARVIVPYLLFYTFGMACYTISNVIVSYYLARKNYLFTVASALLIFLQVGFILLFHDSVKSITIVMSFILILNLVVALGLHFGLTQMLKLEKSLANMYHLVKSKQGNRQLFFAKRK